MALIRNAAASSIARDAVVLDLGDLHRQGEALKRRAQAEAQQILAAAREERQRLLSGAAEEGRTQGLEEGRREGREEGRREGRDAALQERRAELDGLIAGWTGALVDFNARRERMLAEARLDVLTLALRIAERVTRRQITSDPHIVSEQMRAVLAAIARPTQLLLAVHPDDVEVVREAMPEVKAAMGTQAEIVADETLMRGSCVARTSEGATIDASIETQLRRIVEALVPGRGLEGAPPPGDVGAGSDSCEGGAR